MVVGGIAVHSIDASQVAPLLGVYPDADKAGTHLHHVRLRIHLVIQFLAPATPSGHEVDHDALIASAGTVATAMIAAKSRTRTTDSSRRPSATYECGRGARTRGDAGRCG
jgi:hypothetical protein